MITNFNHYIKESIYSDNDINNILDKPSKYWDESDISILKSYATNDQEIKEILNTIKSYTVKFKELNKKLKEASDKGEYPEEDLKKWVKMSKKLSVYENILKNKFKIIDLDKLNKIRKLEKQNESIRDQMTPKSDEEIYQALDNWPVEVKIDLVENHIDTDKLFDYLVESGAKKEDMLKYILDEANEKQLKEIIIDVIAYDDEYDIYTVLNHIIGGYNPVEEKEIILRAYKKYINSTGAEELDEILNNIIMQNPEIIRYRSLYW